MRARRLRIVAAAIVSIGLLVPLAAFGASGNGQSPSAAQYKITICHHTHSKKHPTVTISISNKAWKAHQRHGDTMGACAAAASAKHNNGKAKGHSKNPPTNQSQGNGQNNGQGNGQGQGKGHGK
jgi:hypothetical protein